MRLTTYAFPPDTPEEIRVKHGCKVFLKSGGYIYPESIPDDKRELVDYVGTLIEGCSVKTAKSLMWEFGGSASTQHIDRDGCVFEVTPVTLKGNNSRFKYNRHL